MFPKNFLWGASTAAVQCEGGYLEDGKGLNVADIQICYSKKGGNINYTKALLRERINDVLSDDKKNYYPKHLASDFYHRYEEYIDVLAKLGLKAYRMSINWSRIYPNGDDENPNNEGLEYYHKIFDLLHAKGIEPIVTLTHYDLPLKLVTDYKGWYSKDTRDHYVKYAKTCLDAFHNKVKYWIVINQINLIFGESFSSLGMIMDEYEDFTAAKYQAVHNEYVASAMVKNYAKEKYQDLKIGMMLADQITYALNSDPLAQKAALKANRMKDYFFSDVELRGEYPGYALKYFEDNGIHIEKSAEELKLIKENTLDFLAVAYYYSHCVDETGKKVPNPYTKATEWGWTIDPTGLYNTMSAYWDRYGVPMMIAENGIGVDEKAVDGKLHDDYRIDYHRRHLIELEELFDDGVDIFAYCMWSAFDIVSGNGCEMEKRYGLVYVDYDNYGKGSGDLTLKDSYYWYQKVIASNGREL